MSKERSDENHLNLDVNEKWRIAIVRATFNTEITEALATGAMTEFLKAGVKETQIKRFDVPGSFEIPLVAKWAFQAGYDAVVALGAVIRGDTPHFDYVCASVERGLTQLQLEFARPVVFGVLTTDTVEQAKARADGSHSHKGVEAAQVCLTMLNIKKSF